MVKFLRVHQLLIIVILFQIFSITNYWVFAQEKSESETDLTNLPNNISLESSAVIIAGFATASAFALLAYQTWKLKQEKNQTLRAWIGQSNKEVKIVRVHNPDDKIKHISEWNSMNPSQKDQFNPKFFEYAITLENFGKSPATNVLVRYGVSSVASIDEVKDVEFDSNKSSEIMPHQDYEYSILIPKEIVDKFEIENQKFYLIFETRYNSAQSKKVHEYGFMSELSKGVISKMKTWREK